MMKSIVVASALLICGNTKASCCSHKPFCGFYMGGQLDVGRAFSDFRFEVKKSDRGPGVGSVQRHHASPALIRGGVYGGLGRFINNIYVAGEIGMGVSYTDAQKTFSAAYWDMSSMVREKYNMSLSMKVGRLLNNILFYVRAGYSNACWGLDSRTNGGPYTRLNKNFSGILLGLGMDYALSPTTTCGGEVVYATYQRKKFDFVESTGTKVGEYSVRPAALTVSAKLSKTF